MISYPGKILRVLLFVAGALVLTACSKTVQWEEEVPLNTGERIWVKRYVTYKLQGAGGNPLDIGYRPDWTEEIAFEWMGKKYKYTGDAGIILIAISPLTKQPVLVANAMIGGWYRTNNYKCTMPYYVQFNPDDSGQHWSWPPKIETWLYGSGYNLMHHKPKLGAEQPKYIEQDRKKLDSVVAAQSPHLIRVDASFSFNKTNECLK